MIPVVPQTEDMIEHLVIGVSNWPIGKIISYVCSHSDLTTDEVYGIPASDLIRNVKCEFRERLRDLKPETVMDIYHEET